MPIQSTDLELLESLNTIQAQIPQLAEQSNAVDLEVLSRLDELQMQRTEMATIQETSDLTASKQAMEHYKKVLDLQDKQDNAGLFHDVTAFFTNEDTIADMQEKQRKAAMDVQSIMMQQDFMNTQLKNREAKLINEEQYLLRKRDLQTAQFSRANAVISSVANATDTQQKLIFNTVDNAYTLSEMQKLTSEKQVPKNIAPGVWENVLMEKMRKQQQFVTGAKDTRPLAERMLAGFGNDINQVQVAVSNAKEKGTGYIVDFGGNRFPMNEVLPLVNSYNDAQVKNATQPWMGENSMAIADATNEQLQKVLFQNNEILRDNPTLMAQAAIMQSAFNGSIDPKTGKPVNPGVAGLMQQANEQWNLLTPAQQNAMAGQLLNTTGAFVTNANSLIDKIVAVETKGLPASVAAAAKQFAVAGNLNNIPAEMQAKYTTSVIFQDTNAFATGQSGGRVFRDLYSQWVNAQSEKFASVYSDEGEKSKFSTTVDGKTVIDTDALLAGVFGGSNKPKPDFLFRSVNMDPKWQTQAKMQLGAAVMASQISTLAASFSKTSPGLETKLKALLNPTTGDILATSPAALIQDLQAITKQAQASGELPKDINLVTQFKQSMYPQNINGAIIPNSSIATAINNATADMKKGGRLFMYHVFNGNEVEIISQYLNMITSDNKQEFADAKKIADIFIQTKADPQARSPAAKNLLSEDAKQKIQNDLRTELQGFAPEVVEGVIKELNMKWAK